MHTQNKPDRLQFVFPFLEKKDFKKFHLTQLYLIASPNITTEANTHLLPLRNPLNWLGVALTFAVHIFLGQ